MNSVSPSNPSLNIERKKTGLFKVVKTIAKSDVEIVKHDKWYYLGMIVNITYLILSLYTAWYYPPQEPEWLKLAKGGLVLTGMVITVVILYRSYPELKKKKQMDQIYPQISSIIDSQSN